MEVKGKNKNTYKRNKQGNIFPALSVAKYWKKTTQQVLVFY